MTITLDEILVALTPEEEEEALRGNTKPPSITKPIAPVQDTETIPELASMNTDPMRPPPVAAQRARPRSAAEEVLAMRGGAAPPPSGAGRAGEVLAARRAAAERPSAADEYAAAVRRQRMDEGAQGMITGLTRAITAGRATPNLAPVTQIEDYMRGRALKQEEAGQQQAAQDRATAAARADRDESREERALRLREEGATRDAEADRLRLETARGDHEFQQSLRDPNSPTSQNYKQNFIDTLRILASGEGAREELPGINIDDVLSRVQNMSAYEISTDPSLESLRNHAARMTQTQAGQRTRARGDGSGGRARTAQQQEQLVALQSGQEPALNPLQSRYVEARVRNGSTRADAIGDAIVLPEDELLMGMRQQLGTDTRGTSQLDEEHAIPGFVRRADAPILNPGERARARGLGSQREVLRRSIARLRQIGLGLPEAASARAGYVSAHAAEARSLHENVIAALREIGNYGVPTGTEMQRMEGIAPRADSLESLVNGAELYRGLWSSLGPTLDTQLRALGYDRAGRGR
jgi:hypothetical protein